MTISAQLGMYSFHCTYIHPARWDKDASLSWDSWVVARSNVMDYNTADWAWMPRNWIIV